MPDQVEVLFTGHAAQFDAVPGDRKWVDAEFVAALKAGGIASPATVIDAKEAGLPPEAAATKKAKT